MGPLGTHFLPVCLKVKVKSESKNQLSPEGRSCLWAGGKGWAGGITAPALHTAPGAGRWGPLQWDTHPRMLLKARVQHFNMDRRYSKPHRLQLGNVPNANMAEETEGRPTWWRPRWLPIADPEQNDNSSLTLFGWHIVGNNLSVPSCWRNG